ncbi:MAG: hypothetical protein Kow0059_07360 [Candidatus Sumerlaeia bacterium]
MKPEEHSYAALSHILAILPGWGIFFNVILWLNFKARSHFVVYHAKQAVVFQVFYLLPLLIVMLVVNLAARLVSFLLPFLGSVLNTVNTLVFVLAMVFYVGYCLYGFWKVRTGGDFHYAVAGKFVKQFLSELD